jgi:tRNA modification GTPase
MRWELDDRIAALGSAAGSSPRGVIRATGPAIGAVLEDWFQPDETVVWLGAKLPRRHSGHLRCPGLSSPLPVAVHWWPTLRSYTGQPQWELHLPGAPPVLEAVLAAVLARGVRLARPGEFTLRAFLAGRLDLLQAEAVLGVIDATDDLGLRTALTQLAGGVSGALATLRSDLLNLLADLEAGLDFVEEYLEFVSREELQRRIAAAAAFVERLRVESGSRMQSTGRPRIVLAGLPNAGKSTLFNALVERPAALVSPAAGTTRDFLEAPVEWGPCRFVLVDTAGWEMAADAIETAAQAQRIDQVSRASLCLWCSPPLTGAAREWDDDRFHAAQLSGGEWLRIWTKRDEIVTKTDDRAANADDGLRLSARSGVGLSELKAALVARWQSQAQHAWLGTTAARCQESLSATEKALKQAFLAASDPRCSDELLAIDLRDALEHLGRITGTVYTDDVLDRIFSRFCIGK